MIPLPANGRIFLACGATDMRRGFDGLAVMAQEVLAQDPHSGALFAFRGKRGDLVKLLWWDGQGLCLFAKRLAMAIGGDRNGVADRRAISDAA
jgi:transposase